MVRCCEQQGRAAYCFALLHASSAGTPQNGLSGRAGWTRQAIAAGKVCWSQVVAHLQRHKMQMSTIAGQLSHWLLGMSVARLNVSDLKQLVDLAA